MVRPTTKTPSLLILWLLLALHCTFPDHILKICSASSSQPPPPPLDDVQVVVYDGPQPSTCTSPPTDPLKPTRVQTGHTVGFHFTVTIDTSSLHGTPGHQVESSRDRGIAPSFPVGRGKVIPGLDRGIVGLCKGSRAHIIIPPHLAYGKRGIPESGLPGDTTLRYDVEILDIQPPSPNDFGKIDTNKDWRLSRDEAGAYFREMGQPIDLDGLWNEEDADKDGFISWEEFTGPKGDELPPHLERQRKEKAEEEKRRQQRRQQQEAAAAAAAAEAATAAKVKAKRKQTDERAKDPQNRQQEQDEALAQATALFRQVAGEDDRISKDELGQFFQSMGSALTDEFWRDSDVDGDGYVSLVEWLGPEVAGEESKQPPAGQIDGSEL